jgi:hypothetical protein
MSLQEMRRQVRLLLTERRPDRYTVDGPADEDGEAAAGWLDAIAEEVKDLAPEDEIRKILARNVVGQEEGQATRRANDLLRKYGRTGQMPLDWFDTKDWPIAVVSFHTDSLTQERKKIEERVALRASTAQDFRYFATEERRRAAGDFSARNDACVGAERVADEMDIAGAITFGDWLG